jgi:1-acyl-sn-glycerol-3-phosphate acyltransferase
MIVLRSAVYLTFFVVWTGIVWIVSVPTFLMHRRFLREAMRFWAAGLETGLGVICDIRVEIRGRQWVPTGPALVAPKHQCMFDTVVPFTALRDACFVMKKELMIIPFYGWYSTKGRMIVVDREGHSKALKQLVADARDRIADGRQVVIFPEGTRKEPGSPPNYKPGIAALYRDLGLPVVPVATNSGVHWPPKGFIRRPGTIVFEYLEPIPAGLKRADFMRILQERIETASDRLLEQGI